MTELEQLREENAELKRTLAAVAKWIRFLPIPTRGATRMLGVVYAALGTEDAP